ncbi:MAG: hypothetical protein Ct9H300mP3_00170 [Gammaproteobacteria bacterium]|nr:MAG: hypothetical protein Ct9H300mP3_00170 [Gammaproteobacteria bacterium]
MVQGYSLSRTAHEENVANPDPKVGKRVIRLLFETNWTPQ